MADWQAGFYQRDQATRQKLLASYAQLTPQQIELIEQHDEPQQRSMIENYLASYPLAEGVAINLLVNQQQYVVPMAIEEPSVIAAASNGAKIVMNNGGFQAESTNRLLTGQIVLTEIEDFDSFQAWIEQNRKQIIQVANDSRESLVLRGGGVKKVRLCRINDEFVSIDLLVDVQESMGANSVNTMSEAVGHWLSEQGYSVLTAILSNSASESLAHTSCRLSVAVLGEQTAKQIAALSRFAQSDPERAVTHNKGIMNGIDAAVIASGNDWRAIEAGAHAYAARDGQYRGLSTWKIEGDELVGRITLPMSLGTVGGSMGILPMVTVNRQILKVETVAEMASVFASLGLAQNLAALKALATNGIQAGHMKLQAKSWAIELGASEAEIQQIVPLLRTVKTLDKTVVQELIQRVRGEK